MTMNAEFVEAEERIGRSDLIGYFHPREIVADISLPTSRRRALLAYWMSDANAIPGAPWMRRSGYVTTTLADLRKALADLDEVEAMLMSKTMPNSQFDAV